MSSSLRSDRALGAAGLAVLLVWTAAVYLPVGDFGFVSYDDPDYVTKHPVVRAGLSTDGLHRAFSEEHHGNWHPLTTLSYMLEVEFFGVDPGVQHRVNLALHLLSTVLLFLLLVRTTQRPWRSLAVAALFALHPLHVESVAWISQRKDVLCTFFGLAAALVYTGYVRRPSAARYAGVLALFAAGLGSKPMLVTWPFVLLLLDVWPLGRFEGGGEDAAPRIRRAVLEKLPLLALSAAASVLTVWAQSEGGALRSTQLHPLFDRVANALVAYAVYLWQAVWPVHLGVLYPHPRSLPLGTVLASAALLAAVSAVCLRERRRRPYLLVGWLWFLGTLVPVIGLVQVGAQAHADRYTYIPLIGIFVALVWTTGDAVASRPRLQRAGAAAALAGLAALSLATARQVRVWESSEVLYRHTLAVTERNPIIHNNLGIALDELGRHEEAVQVYEEGLALPSEMAHVLSYNAGIGLARLGRHEEAVSRFDDALRIDPGYTEALYHKGRSLRALGRNEEARTALERVIALAPDEADPHVELGLALGHLGRSAQAKRHFERAVALQPRHLDARINLAVALLKTGEPEAATRELERVLELRPGHPGALHYLATARSMKAPDGP